MATRTSAPRVAVVGAGINGLVCANRLVSETNARVTLFEAHRDVGGSARSIRAAFTDGVVRSVDGGAAVYPLGAVSPAFQSLLPEIEWCRPRGSYAQVLNDGTVVVAWQSLADTCRGLGAEGSAWAAFIKAVPRDWAIETLTNGLRWSALANDLRALWTVKYSRLGRRSKALFAGVAAHAGTKFGALPGVVTGYVLAQLAHGEWGWPLPSGGSSAVADGLLRRFIAHGGTYQSDTPVHEVPSGFEEVIFDTRRKAASHIIARGTRSPLEVSPTRAHDNGFGSLSQAFPASGWRHSAHTSTVQRIDLYYAQTPCWRDRRLYDVGTIHFGGDAVAIEVAMSPPNDGNRSASPYGMLVVPGQHDSSRDPGLVWAYVHVPWGAKNYVTTVVNLIEQLAPGSAEKLMAHRVVQGSELGELSSNLVDGDIGAGPVTMPRLLRGKMLPKHSYRIGEHSWLCSAETPPGPGAHGWCGWNAAAAVIETLGEPQRNAR